MKKLTHEDIHCAFRRRVSRSEYDYSPERVESMHNDHIRKQMADFIVREKAVKTSDDFYHELRLDLYVATPKVFWEIVEREAENIAMRFK